MNTFSRAFILTAGAGFFMSASALSSTILSSDTSKATVDGGDTITVPPGKDMHYSDDIVDRFAKAIDFYHQQGRHDQEKELSRKMLEFCEKDCGKNSRQTAKTLTRIAQSSAADGDYLSASQQNGRAISILKAMQSPQSSNELATMLAAQSTYYGRLGKFNEADAEYKRLLSIFDKSQHESAKLMYLPTYINILKAAGWSERALEAEAQMTQLQKKFEGANGRVAFANPGMVTDW